MGVSQKFFFCDGPRLTRPQTTSTLQTVMQHLDFICLVMIKVTLVLEKVPEKGQKDYILLMMCDKVLKWKDLKIFKEPINQK